MHLAHSALMYPPTQYLHVQNGWNVLHHTCASDENSYSVLRWLLEEFTHCDLLKTRDFLNQVQQVWLSPILSISLLTLSQSKHHPKIPK